MSAEALSAYGIDIYPGGPLSAYRTSAQRTGLYKPFLASRGGPRQPTRHLLTRVRNRRRPRDTVDAPATPTLT
jgi:hypothetical protein